MQNAGLTCAALQNSSVFTIDMFRLSLHNTDMDQALRNIIYSAAARIRAWAENLPQNRRRRDQWSLDGFCAIAAAQLWRELHSLGITAGICVHTSRDGSSHVFLKVEDHVVDITATQFGLDPVVILHERLAAEHWFYDVWEQFDNPARLREHQVREGWPVEQTARV